MPRSLLTQPNIPASNDNTTAHVTLSLNTKASSVGGSNSVIVTTTSAAITPAFTTQFVTSVQTTPVEAIIIKVVLPNPGHQLPLFQVQVVHTGSYSTITL